MPEAFADDYFKRGEIAPTLVRIETKLDNDKWILGVVVAIIVAIATGLTVSIIMLALQSG